MEDGLAKRGHSLEEAFFRERSAQLIAQRQKLEQMKQTKESLAAVSGIKNEKVLNKLAELEISPTILASLMVLPLVEVAWADGTLSDAEKQAILSEVSKGDATQGSLDQSLLEAWLKERPSSKYLEAWLHYVEGLREVLKADELQALKEQLLNKAKKVANSEGEFLSFSKISDKEKAVLKKMEDAFKS